MGRIVGLIAAALLASGAQASVLGDEPGPVAQYLAEARQASTLGHGAARRITELGAAVVPEVIQIIDQGSFSIRAGGDQRADAPLRGHEERSLFEALDQLPWSDVREALTRDVQDDPGQDRRALLLRIVAEYGTAGDVDLLTEWAAPATHRRVPLSLRRAFLEALETHLARHPAAVDSTVSSFREIHPSLIPGVVSALGAEGNSGGLTALSSLLGRVPMADVLVLAEIAHAARAMRPPYPEVAAERVRPFLLVEDEDLALEALVAIGRLDDQAAIPDLLRVLSFAEGARRVRTFETLESISGQRMSRDLEVWSAWYDREVSWWRLSAPALLGKARNGAAPHATRAVLELSKHRIHRQTVAKELASCLGRTEEEVLTVVCAALGHLGCVESVPALLAALDASSVEVRRAAHQALRRITGEDHGEHAAAWTAAGW